LKKEFKKEFKYEDKLLGGAFGLTTSRLLDKLRNIFRFLKWLITS